MVKAPFSSFYYSSFHAFGPFLLRCMSVKSRAYREKTLHSKALPPCKAISDFLFQSVMRKTNELWVADITNQRTGSFFFLNDMFFNTCRQVYSQRRTHKTFERVYYTVLPVLEARFTSSSLVVVVVKRPKLRPLKGEI